MNNLLERITHRHRESKIVILGRGFNFNAVLGLTSYNYLTLTPMPFIVRMPLKVTIRGVEGLTYLLLPLPKYHPDNIVTKNKCGD